MPRHGKERLQMKNRLIALSLVVGFVLCMVSACSGETDSSATASALPAIATTDSSSDSDASTDASVSAEAKPVTYPLADPSTPIEITFWTSFGFGFDRWIDSFNSLPRMEDVLQATGVKYTFIEVGQTAATQQFNLMIAGGDWPDIIQATDYYVGGLTAAYADGVIADLTDIIPQAAPDYYNILMNKTNEDTISLLQTDGMFLSMNTLKTESVSDQGLVMRGDWLDTLGLEAPTTLDEFTDALYAIHDKYSTSKTYYVKTTGTIQYMDNCFATSIFGVTNSTGIATYLEGDKIVSGLVADGFRDYIEYFHKLYADGIIDTNFYTSQDTENDIYSNIGQGQAGAWVCPADAMTKAQQYCTDENYKAVAVAPLVNNEGDTYTFGALQTLADNKGYSITTSCSDVAAVCSFFNYFFTEEGSILGNYGKEDVTFTYDADGNPQYTDLILNNEDESLNPLMAIVVNTFSQCPIYNDVTKMWATYTDDETAAIKLWSNTDNVTYDHSIPSAAAITTEQTNAIATPMNDVISYASEAVLKFMTGTTELTDDSWNEYVQTCKDFGLEKCVAEYQTAYDNYLASKG